MSATDANTKIGERRLLVMMAGSSHGRRGFRSGVEKRRAADFSAALRKIYPGGVLLSHPVARAVSSAMQSLTAVFGMGTGVTSAL
jgi:hypothetical protein